MHEPLPGPIVHAARADLPVLLSVPHAGREYPDWLLDMSTGGRAALCTLEDPLVDRLVWRALSRGFGAVVAMAPRAAIDCNRDEDEIDPSIVHCSRGTRPSARARGGLGIVPSRTAAHGNLWRRAISRAELQQRIDQVHRPFHGEIARMIDDTVGRFGHAILLDCHSMPAPAPGVPPIVFGDRFGRSSAPWVTGTAIRIAGERGFPAAANDPFAGGHVLSRHGAPHRGVHALQIEIDRRCYLDSGGQPNAHLDSVAELIEALAVGLGGALLERELPTAAE